MISFTGKKWKESPFQENKYNQIISKTNNSIISHLLATRQVDIEEIDSFLEPKLSLIPNPFLFKDMDKAVEIIIQYIVKKEPIIIYGDYDVDGTTSVAILCRFLKSIDAEVYPFIPHRITDGYGLHTESIQWIADNGGKLIISVDCGIVSFEEAVYAKKIGIELIITDHHLLENNKIPDAGAVINPNRSDCLYPDKNLCGAGVAYNLVLALRMKLRENGYFKDIKEPDIKKLLAFTAMGTVGDVVPLTGINRIFVKYGIEELEKSHFKGVEALKRVSQVKEMNTTALGFRICPRINASGRMDSANDSLALLLCDDNAEAFEIAEKLNNYNSERQYIEEQILQEAKEQAIIQVNAGFKTIVVLSENWHPGVVGIVASRLTEQFGRPSIVLYIDKETNTIKGSGRSIDKIHLRDVLSECSHFLLRFGGHKHAAGLAVSCKNFDDFRKSFEDIIKRQVIDEDLYPTIYFDKWLDIKDINFETLDTIKKLEPFGTNNREPVFGLKNIRISDLSKIKEKHYKFKIKAENKSISALWWKNAHIEIENKNVDILFQIESTEWNNKKEIQLNIKDVRNIQANLF